MQTTIHVEGIAGREGDGPAQQSGDRAGHVPRLVVGDLEGVRVAAFGGRAHYYETGDPRAMRLPLETLRSLGAEAVILTNAAGSLRPDMPTGSVMLLSDHINFSGLNPLIGEPTDARPGRVVRGRGWTGWPDGGCKASAKAWSW